MNLLQQLNQELADIVGRVRPTLVQVQDGGRGAGAGAVWHPDGLVVTNAHVVAASRKRGVQPLVALPDGRRLAAQLLAYDEERDIAALKISAHDLPTIELGDSRQLRPGDWVIAVGHPWGVVGAATAGSVITVGPSPELPYRGELIQVGLHMRPGHSGGALVDRLGRLVGINCMMAGPDVGLAVPTHVVTTFLRRALNKPNATPDAKHL